MYNTDLPTRAELPSTGKLLRSTAIAALMATVLLITTILPSEYGIDPTGIGRALGLTQMGEIKLALAKEGAKPSAPASSETPPPTVAVATVSSRTDVTTISLQPNEGKEVKLVMREGAKATFSWSVDRGVVNYDLHADSVDPPRDYHGYRKGKGATSDEGVLEAAFNGSHGWHWRNKASETVTVTLRTQGEYEDVKVLE